MIKLQAKRSLGQNFLIDPKIHDKIVRTIAPKPEDTFIEIGPGTGLLTRALLESPLKKLVAFELDSRAIPELIKEFAKYPDRFEVIEQDILKVDLAALSKELGTRLRMIGNIPYYITSPILFQALDQKEIIQDATFLVQLEVAERLAAETRTKAYGIPTVLANFLGEVRFLFKVPAGAFRPIPKVDSAVIHINMERDYFTRTGEAPPPDFDVAKFKTLVKGAFAMRRKTMRNNLKSTPFGGNIERMESTEEGKKYLSQRAEELSIADYLRIYSIIVP